MTTILVIEDEMAMRESLVDLLESEGFTTIVADNGSLGLELAFSTHPDLILCDIRMPNLDGYEVLRQLRHHPQTRATPFIFLAARNNRADFRQGMELGADDYLLKPCGSEELLAAISARLAKKSAIRAEAATKTYRSSRSREGLLNYFYQELRNPMSNLNTVIYLLRNVPETRPTALTLKSICQEYGRELSVLQEVAKLQECLTPESAELLRSCQLHNLEGDRTRKLEPPQSRSQGLEKQTIPDFQNP
jgi:CheY-like chemotaxis protein